MVVNDPTLRVSLDLPQPKSPLYVRVACWPHFLGGHGACDLDDVDVLRGAAKVLESAPCGGDAWILLLGCKKERA
jgi:hypothetical protein